MNNDIKKYLLLLFTMITNRYFKITNFEESHKTGICLFDLLTLDIVLKNGLNYKLILNYIISAICFVSFNLLITFL